MERDEYRQMAEVESSHWWYQATRALLIQELGPYLHRRGGPYLDAGAGTGATGAWLRQGGALVAADLEPLALDHYRRAHLHPAVAGAVAADLAHLPFADQSFAAVLCVTVLYHRAVHSPAAVVGELARLLRPGGVLCLLEPGVKRLRRGHDRVTHGERRFSRGELAGLCTGHGLRVERATGVYSFLVPPAAVKAVTERGRTTSDLASHAGGLGGVLGAGAALERRLLRRVALPTGLSLLVIARRPDAQLARTAPA